MRLPFSLCDLWVLFSLPQSWLYSSFCSWLVHLKCCLNSSRKPKDSTWYSWKSTGEKNDRSVKRSDSTCLSPRTGILAPASHKEERNYQRSQVIKAFFSPLDSANVARGSLAFGQARLAAHSMLNWESSPWMWEQNLCLPGSLSSPVILYCTANRSNWDFFYGPSIRERRKCKCLLFRWRHHPGWQPAKWKELHSETCKNFYCRHRIMNPCEDLILVSANCTSA